ncbi:MAG: DUF4421 domain-containing protein [Bacteroidales bacterium]|jgi:hypothetical protein|nr:DUF4421 domain-containing protein [Bacteroidales bacterium]
MDKMHCKAIVLLAVLLNTSLSFAEGPAAGENIVPFPQTMAISVFGISNMEIFLEEWSQYKADKPWTMGVGFRYKNLAAQAAIPLPFNTGAFDLAVNFYLEKMYFETFVKHYQKFYPDDVETIGNEDIGLDIMSAGIMASRVYNHKNHSFRSVYSLSQKQTASSGSFLYGLGVFYSSLHSQNGFIPRYAERQHVVYFGPTAGYSYTWVYDHDLYLNLDLNLGANLGIDINETKLLFIPQAYPRITFGHHNSAWSLNSVVGANASMFLWDGGNLETILPVTICITFSKRF